MSLHFCTPLLLYPPIDFLACFSTIFLYSFLTFSSTSFTLLSQTHSVCFINVLICFPVIIFLAFSFSLSLFSFLILLNCFFLLPFCSIPFSSYYHHYSSQCCFLLFLRLIILVTISFFSSLTFLFLSFFLSVFFSFFSPFSSLSFKHFYRSSSASPSRKYALRQKGVHHFASPEGLVSSRQPSGVSYQHTHETPSFLHVA